MHKKWPRIIQKGTSSESFEIRYCVLWTPHTSFFLVGKEAVLVMCPKYSSMFSGQLPIYKYCKKEERVESRKSRKHCK